MTKRNIVLSLIGLILAVYFYNTVFLKSMITGEYVAYVTDEFGSNGIKHSDKIKLFEDNTFTSQCWGKGTYKLKYSLKETRIYFSFKNEGYSTYFYRTLFIGKPKIVIFRDLNSAFEKQ